MYIRHSYIIVVIVVVVAANQTLRNANSAQLDGPVAGGWLKRSHSIYRRFFDVATVCVFLCSEVCVYIT